VGINRALGQASSQVRCASYQRTAASNSATASGCSRCTRVERECIYLHFTCGRYLIVVLTPATSVYQNLGSVQPAIRSGQWRRVWL